MLSQTTEYALRIMVYLASLKGTPATLPQIAAATQTPAGYLAKVLRNLALAGLLRSQRGLHGGSVLARPAHAISVLDVVQAVDPIQRIKQCPLGIKGHGINLCPLHRRLDEAIAMVEKAFASSSLADLIPEQADVEPFCDPSVTRQTKRLRVLR
jgi:Rrf2 family nitric oxide-sensitive transcriptional repressor